MNWYKRSNFVWKITGENQTYLNTFRIVSSRTLFVGSKINIELKRTVLNSENKLGKKALFSVFLLF